MEARQEFCHSDLIHLLDLIEPNERGQNLTAQQIKAAMNLLTNKILKNPMFAGKEADVSLELINLTSNYFR